MTAGKDRHRILGGGAMDILGGIAILLALAAFGAWQMPDVLMHIEARLHARRRGIMAQRVVYQRHLLKLQREN
jgi:hypothetical protein